MMTEYKVVLIAKEESGDVELEQVTLFGKLHDWEHLGVTFDRHLPEEEDNADEEWWENETPTLIFAPK